MSSCPHPTSEDPPATLLVFTLGARRESRRRRLLPAAQGPVEDGFHQACLESALAAGRDAGLRLEVCSPLELALPADVERRPQRGRDFGSRLEAALARTFAEREGPVVLVGSDVPDLSAGHLRRALEALEEDPDRVVLGPSPDGGFYLLAANRPLGAALSRVRWRCRRTLSSLKRALRRQGREIVLLPTLADLDRRADLERWLAGSARAEHWQSDLRRLLVARVKEILADLRRAEWQDIALFLLPATSRAHSLRGPPLPA